MTKRKSEPDTPKDESSAYSNFEELAKKLLKVDKVELDELEKKHTPKKKVKDGTSRDYKN